MTISRREFAALLGVNPDTLSGYVSRGQAPPPDTRPGDPDYPGWLESTAATYARNRAGRGARTDLAAASLPDTDGRWTLRREGVDRRLLGDLHTDRRADAVRFAPGAEWEHTPGVRITHVADGWQLWSDGTVTVGGWVGSRAACLASPAIEAIDLLVGAIGWERLPVHPADLVTTTDVTSEILASKHRRATDSWAAVTLAAHTVRYETRPDDDGAWWERSLPLWTVTIVAGYHDEDGDHTEDRLIYATEEDARQRHVRALADEFPEEARTPAAD